MKKPKKRALFAQFVAGETVEELAGAVPGLGNAYGAVCTDAVAYVEKAIRKGIRKGWAEEDLGGAPAGFRAVACNTCEGCHFDDKPAYKCPAEDCLANPRPDRTSVIFVKKGA